jgi:hypothetical protein
MAMTTSMPTLRRRDERSPSDVTNYNEPTKVILQREERNKILPLRVSRRRTVYFSTLVCAIVGHPLRVSGPRAEVQVEETASLRVEAVETEEEAETAAVETKR